MINWDKDLPENHPVAFNFNGTYGLGRIRGLASTYPGVRMWIVEITSISNLDVTLYPYTCIVVPSGNLSFVE